MPVYNEQDSIETVISRWDLALSTLGMDYRIRVFNDGSQDATEHKLDELATRYPRLEVHHKANSGHGPTILVGYRGAADSEWLFQIDSDDEMGPEGFAGLWARRRDFDFLLGCRSNRWSPWSRRCISLVSRCAVALLYGPGVKDVNAPYRLMRTAKFKELFEALSDNTFAPNVIISGFACHRKLRILEMPVAFRQRLTGEVSIRKWRLFKAAVKSFWQTVGFRYSRLTKLG